MTARNGFARELLIASAPWSETTGGPTSQCRYPPDCRPKRPRNTPPDRSHQPDHNLAEGLAPDAPGTVPTPGASMTASRRASSPQAPLSGSTAFRCLASCPDTGDHALLRYDRRYAAAHRPAGTRPRTADRGLAVCRTHRDLLDLLLTGTQGVRRRLGVMKPGVTGGSATPYVDRDQLSGPCSRRRCTTSTSGPSST